MCNKSKQIITCILFLIITTSFNPFVIFANDVDEYYEMQNCPVYSSFEDALDNTLLIQPYSDTEFYTLEPIFYRSGETEKVHVYMIYNGTKPANAIDIRNFEIWNTNLLKRKQLVPTFSIGVKEFTSHTYAQIPIRRENPIYLSASIKAVRVDIGTRKVYIPGHGWLQGNDPIGQWPIK
ncbi:hypothetical protein ACDL92_11435 [Ihubacter sp. mB4P-1]|uniref:hypothetical protein n=1 Tax=Ihubacter sp. mB4P-1 TaxID=3242370 RepID=UPI003C7C5E29